MHSLDLEGDQQVIAYEGEKPGMIKISRNYFPSKNPSVETTNHSGGYYIICYAFVLIIDAPFVLLVSAYWLTNALD